MQERLALGTLNALTDAAAPHICFLTLPRRTRRSFINPPRPCACSACEILCSANTAHIYLRIYLSTQGRLGTSGCRNATMRISRVLGYIIAKSNVFLEVQKSRREIRLPPRKIRFDAPNCPKRLILEEFGRFVWGGVLGGPQLLHNLNLRNFICAYIVGRGGMGEAL